MTKQTPEKTAVSRRQVLSGACGSVAALVGLSVTMRPAHATPEEAAKLASELTGGKEAVEGRVSLKLPQIAENGNTVPVTIEVDSPMTDDDYVKAIHVMADGNPTPNVASFNLSPGAGKAEVSVRMRLAKTQNVIALAEMNDGSVYKAAQEIKVTIGGCGG